MKQAFFQEEAFLIKFEKVGTKSLISAFSKLVLSIYSAISHDPLNQSNSLSLLEKQFKASCNKEVKIKNSKELRALGPSLPKLT